MIYGILAALLFISFMQKDTNNKILSCCYTGSILLHGLMFGNINSSLYYVTASLFDFLIILIILRSFLGKPIAARLISICIISIVVNGMGALIWFFGMEPTIYNYIFITIYWAALVVLLKEELHGGNITSGSTDSIFYGTSCNCPDACMEVPEKA